MLEFVKFMLDGSLFKGIVFIIIIYAITVIVQTIFGCISTLFKSLKKESNNFFISEKNVDKKFVEELKKSGKG